MEHQQLNEDTLASSRRHLKGHQQQNTIDNCNNKPALRRISLVSFRDEISVANVETPFTSSAFDTISMGDIIGDRKKSKEFPKNFTINKDSSTIDDEMLTAKRNKSVWCLRTFTLTTLVAAAIIVALLTFTYSHASEIKQFERQYYDSVVKVEEAIAIGISNKINTAKTFSAIYTSRYGPDNIWPNSTMPSQEFKAQAAGLLEIANGIAISFNPIISKQNREMFEAHADESASILGAEELVTRSCDDSSGATCRVVADGIYRKAPSPSGDGLINTNDPGFSEGSRYPFTMVPVWQIFPTEVNWKAVMFNLHSEMNRQHALDDMLQYKVPTVTALLHLVQHKEMNPSSILFYPVFNRFRDESSNFQQNEIVGSISIVFQWEDILRQVLPAYIEGMVVVLESSVSSDLPRQLWSFDVSGEVVTLLGEGDLHNAKFDDFEHSVQANVAKDAEELGIVDYLITYKIRIYPSEQLKDMYITTKPAIMTAVVICIFIITSLIFLAYDYLVNHRQHAIMAFATKTERIVNSLFPASVRDRLFTNAEHVDQHMKISSEADEESGCLHQNDRTNTLKTRLSKSILRKRKFERLKSFMGMGIGTGSRRDSGGSYGSSLTEIFNTPPIADLFEETSIMFADIVGFTEWSSKRCPEDVFHLLETLFLEFDRIAARMNVFKLGTIGDCYIAVTGIPDENPTHAVILCQFAEECRLKMHDVIKELENILEGVTKLDMRFGIHSGPVTAGVLRGTKSRFELFGDTINTASRMESLSLPGKIQISQQTADLLRKADKNDWVKPRIAVVHPKGKGAMQTYWFATDNTFTDGDNNGNAESPLTYVTDNEKASQFLFCPDEDSVEVMSHDSSSSSIFVEKK